DILLTGYTQSGARISRVYRNNTPVANTPPTAPTNLSAQLTGATTLALSWDASTDAQTAAAGLTYNLRVGTTPGGSEICSAHADPATGLRHVPRLGNAQQRTTWELEVPDGVVYYWSVQALDACFAGSAFAAEAQSRIENLVVAPEPLEISLVDDVGGGVYKDAVAIRYLGGGSAPVHGYSIDLTWDPAVITATAGDFARPDSGPFSTTTWFIAQIISPGHARIDASLPGGNAGTTAGDLFNVTFTAVGTPDHATSALALTINSVRDANNQDVGGLLAGPGEAIVDLVAPSVTAVLIENTTLVHTDDYLKNTDAIRVTATVTDGDPGFALGNIVADLSGFGGSATATPASYASNLATWTVASAACNPANGTVTVTVTGTDPLGNSANSNDTIIADNVAPTPVTGLTASPGHKKINLAWTDAAGQDTYYAGVVIRYAKWNDYANYGSQPTPTLAPAYPADKAAGDGTAFDGTGAAAIHAFTPDNRDIYYYSAFVYDIARNYSTVSGGGRDRATNYWLGDVSDGDYGEYDGYVDVGDYTALASTYGLIENAGGWKDQCDVGPTDDHSRVGIPLPDDQVQFEDLMIFAMNAGLVSPLAAPPTGTPEPVLAWTQIDELNWSLQLVEPCANFKGVNVTAELPAGSVMVAAGELMGHQPAPVFVKNIDRQGLDAGLAIMGQGQGIVGSGELLRVSLAEGADPGNVRIAARGIGNEAFSIEPLTPTDVPAPLPFDLGQNAPNPFNPQTKIVFSLPESETVRMTVYTLDGRRVRALLDEPRAAGVHEVIWDGRDDGGRQVASGTYVYRLTAGLYSETRKMSLMK
ncbi:MAG: FlgD immunoglobulin-like domain containing protein, partial [Vicinamibacterales bacterium]|nr:FlgD immunoglobulin-like domain containing protein [Vicinamibacterales bacterium]